MRTLLEKKNLSAFVNILRPIGRAMSWHEHETCPFTWQNSMEAATEASWLSASSAWGCRLLADPELLEFTFGVIPAIPREFHTVFFPNVVRLPSIPILLESG